MPSVLSMSRHLIVIAGALLLWAVPPAHAGESESASGPGECAGEYRYVGGAAQRQQRESAIESVVEDMNIFVRGIARARIRRATPVIERIGLSRAGEATTVVLDDRGYTTPRDGVGVEVDTPGGHRARLTHWRRGVALEQNFDTEDGGRMNLYRCEGKRMDVDVRIRSPHLPRDIRYRLSYARP